VNITGHVWALEATKGSCPYLIEDRKALSRQTQAFPAARAIVAQRHSDDRPLPERGDDEFLEVRAGPRARLWRGSPGALVPLMEHPDSSRQAVAVMPELVCDDYGRVFPAFENPLDKELVVLDGAPADPVSSYDV